MNSSPIPSATISSTAAESPTSANGPLIDCVGLRKQFGRTEVLRGVDLKVPRGAVVGLVGTNGAGKSTLIKCLLGLLQPTGGRATIFGEDPWQLSAAAKSRLGYVPQTVQLYPWMRVRQVVSYTAAFYPTWDAAWAETLLDRLELPREERVGPMSLGQQQKLALVLAMGHRPELLILDEPVASLDPIARRELLQSMMQLILETQPTILFSSHITSDLERVATHIAVLQQGRIALFEELDAVKDRVKRLRVHAASALPSSLEIPGTLHEQIQGPQALVAIRNFDEAQLDVIRLRFQAEVTIEDLNLEDIFVELHRESR